ncbi:MAG TPA: SNF2-related protein, partial [Bacteroidales bacterium]|nr:SNF2-related protein [Bacteroidales bacterium]
MDSKNFITNSKTRSLRKRLHELIHHSNELKFLVGFFYFSGLEELYDAIKDRDDLIIKILVGLDVDEKFEHIFELAVPQDSFTNEDKIDRFFESLGKALNAEELDQESFFRQVHFFVRLLEEKRLLIRKTIDPNHAKLYLFKIKDDVQTLINNDSRFITGSSNLTSAGLQRQHEFNVEIGDYGTKDAETYFDELWETAIPITEIDRRRKYLINLIRYKSQAAYVTPYEAYVHILKTYLDLMEQKTVKPQVIRLLEDKGYTTYQYQLDAVNQALSIIGQYNGVIIADVVGLGKSIIASMIAKNLGKRGMVISPPGLMGDREGQSGWHKYINDFKLYDWELRSSGNLEKAVDYLREYGDDIEVVVIDEAHRFRNQDTADYELLNTICRNRIVILMTATPFNNSPADIFSLLKLFIVPGKSKITLDNNLDGRFNHYDFIFQRLSYISKYGRSKDPIKRGRAEQYFELLFGQLPINMEMVKQRAHQLSREIRYALEPVLIRRNRIDLVKDSEYRKEVTNLSTVENPEELYFGLDVVQLQFYDKVINEYFGDGGVFKGAIYQPFNYEKKRSMDRLDVNENRAFQQQRNLFEFMRRLLVKRFESSFGSFRKSIENFERIHEIVLKFIENSGGRYILDRRLIEKIYEEDV